MTAVTSSQWELNNVTLELTRARIHGPASHQIHQCRKWKGYVHGSPEPLRPSTTWHSHFHNNLSSWEVRTVAMNRRSESFQSGGRKQANNALRTQRALGFSIATLETRRQRSSDLESESNELQPRLPYSRSNKSRWWQSHDFSDMQGLTISRSHVFLLLEKITHQNKEVSQERR